MKGVNDTIILFGIIAFITVLAFLQASFSTEIIESREGWNESYIADNETAIGGASGVLPPPPVCTRFVSGYIPIIGDLIDGVACMGGYILWMLSLMFVSSEVQWVYQLILFPIIAVVGLIIVRLVRSGGG
jgi:hypothetical protein